VPVNRRSGVLSPDGRLANSGVCSSGCTSYALDLSCRSHALIASARSKPSLEPPPNGHSDRIAFDIILDRAAARGEQTSLSVYVSNIPSPEADLECSVDNLEIGKWMQNCGTRLSSSTVRM
jgi:hypothetical protein